MSDYKKELMYSYLIVLTICATAGLQCWRTLFDNFSVHGVGLEGNHIGMLQSVREIPGFLAGAFFSFISLCLVQLIKTDHPPA